MPRIVVKPANASGLWSLNPWTICSRSSSGVVFDIPASARPSSSARSPIACSSVISRLNQSDLERLGDGAVAGCAGPEAASFLVARRHLERRDERVAQSRQGGALSVVEQRAGSEHRERLADRLADLGAVGKVVWDRVPARSRA